MNTKTIIAILIVTVLIVSALPALAHADEKQIGDEEKHIDEKESAEDSDDEITEKMDKSSEKSKSVRQSIEDRVMKKKELLERAKKTREEAKEAFKAAKDELKEAREKAKESRKELKNLKEELQKCKGVEGEDCKKTRRDAKTHAAKFVDGSTEQVFKTLQRAKEAIEKSNMPEDQKAQFIADFDEKIQALNTLRQKQGQIQSQSTTKEIKDAAKNVKEFWKTQKEDIKKANSKVSIARFGGTIVKAEQLQEKLDTKLEQFKNQGKDTTELETKITAFKEKLSTARTAHDEAASLIEQNSVKEATAKMREAHTALKEAHTLLTEIRNAFKAQEQLTAALNG